MWGGESGGGLRCRAGDVSEGRRAGVGGRREGGEHPDLEERDYRGTEAAKSWATDVSDGGEKR